MADEPNVTQQATETQEPVQPTETQEPTVSDPKDAELQAVKEKLSRYEQLVVSPEYAEFLATKTAQKVQQTQQQAPREYSVEERKAFVEKLEGMSRAEFAAFVRDVTIDQVRQQLFAPVVQSMVTEKVQTQIAAAASKFPDFWDYQKDMIALANVNPALTAEQAYHLAKSTKAPAPKPSTTPRRGGEPPSSPPAARTEKQPDTFQAAFDAAFKKVGL